MLHFAQSEAITFFITLLREDQLSEKIRGNNPSVVYARNHPCQRDERLNKFGLCRSRAATRVHDEDERAVTDDDTDTPYTIMNVDNFGAQRPTIGCRNPV